MLLALATLQETRSAAADLTTRLKAIADKHASFWNASFSFALHNESVEVAVASGLNDHMRRTNLTTDHGIPVGSTTKMYSAVSALRLQERGLLSLDEPVAPHVDRYLAVELPCDEAPPYCAAQCDATASCWAERSGEGCANITREGWATCTYCVRFFHCDGPQAAGAPRAVTLTMLWENDATIEQVTFRQLLTMSSGIGDYFLDHTNWLYDQSIARNRTVEPLEYLAHMSHGFIFPPGATETVPAGRPGAGMNVTRGSYSTNGFSLVGLALAGVLNLTDWAQLDQRELAWGTHLFDDDASVFPTRGTCRSYPTVAEQYTSENSRVRFHAITDRPCLNSWLGGNFAGPSRDSSSLQLLPAARCSPRCIAASWDAVTGRPLDVARFVFSAFEPSAPRALLSRESLAQLETYHPLTDSFGDFSLA
jgi:CubicO group peptidase (beta-lactamase class C family)